MLKETEAEETIGFVLSFLSLVAFQLGGQAPWASLVTPMVLWLPDKFALTPIIKFGITNKLLKNIYRNRNTKQL